eukprot:CAMPEP_0185705980 /NCGR_PEP_ID=MMETSP1164-20130828/20958_1 /TAXON_ID=1104430 /ORGANISM="Chrysoreinhardia sp, Strain CCMP2950" /LENGTH=144 /DNA_ID=CAMNT_0028373373 /DNA_START=44 /DNA_END=475 /DNA_ORIENTATION=-
MPAAKSATSFGETMRLAIAEKERTENDLADAVAQSALDDTEEESVGERAYLKAARAAHTEAQTRVSRLIEEAALYAERAKELSTSMDSIAKELEAATKERDEWKKRAEERLRTTEDAKHGEAMARSETEEAERSRAAAVKDAET